MYEFKMNILPKVGIRDNPKATNTACVPVREFLFATIEEDDAEVGRVIPRAGNICDVTSRLSLAATAAGFDIKSVSS